MADTLFGRVTQPPVEEPERPGSKIIKDAVIIQRHLANPDFTCLVSFPRTGSHWLRMLMELYFVRPTLVLAFYYHNRQDYLLLHTHDLELDLARSNVLYLYRHPATTVYSQMLYHGEDVSNRDRMIHWADLYGRHLDKWLCQERFTTRKTVVTYGEMKNDIQAVFAKIAAHFNVPFDREKLAHAVLRVTKDEVKQKTPHDPRVIRSEAETADHRRCFVERHSAAIMETVLCGREHLRDQLSAEPCV